MGLQMSEIRERIEEALKDIAIKYAPEGSDYKAVVHQWIYAILNKKDFFGGSKEICKNLLLKILKERGLYENDAQLALSFAGPSAIDFREGGSISFIDLFAGIGGMRLGFQEAGGICVFSSEFEKNAQETYLRNFNEQPFGDITKISEELIPDHDVLLAGFPCQPFSHAGLKLGVEDVRGTLFYDIARILKKKKPKVALLENVRGLVSHDKGYTLKVILKTLMDIGYKSVIDEDVVNSEDVSVLKEAAKKMILKSKDFGVPQNRQRIYLVLWREDIVFDFKYPDPPFLPISVRDVLEQDVAEKYVISDKLWAGHQRRKLRNKLNGKGFGYGLFDEESEYTNTISARYYKDGSEILIDRKEGNPRKLTPREAARLQGFPESFRIHQSDVQAYRQFGNSVSVPVVRALAELIINKL